MYHEYEYYVNEGDNFEKTKEQLDDIKKLDKGYRKFKKVINNIFNGREYKSVNIEIYLSSDTGCRIRDAITGKYSEHLVGSKEEDLYFKAHVEVTIAGYSQGSAFYASPEDYERHQFTILPSETKQKWYEKNLVARR
jgi:hypothetical protein